MDLTWNSAFSDFVQCFLTVNLAFYFMSNYMRSYAPYSQIIPKVIYLVCHFFHISYVYVQSWRTDTVAYASDKLKYARRLNLLWLVYFYLTSNIIDEDRNKLKHPPPLHPILLRWVVSIESYRKINISLNIPGFGIFSQEDLSIRVYLHLTQNNSFKVNKWPSKSTNMNCALKIIVVICLWVILALL